MVAVMELPADPFSGVLDDNTTVVEAIAEEIRITPAFLPSVARSQLEQCLDQGREALGSVT